MNREELIAFINENATEDDFTGGVSRKAVEDVEAELRVAFSKSYKWFLETYGSGGLFGVDILGCGKSSNPGVISNTERWRKLGLSHHYVVIENCEEFVYCLDTSKFSDQECPIISWDRVAGYSGERAVNFQEFLSDRLVAAKENWEDDF